MCQDKGGSRILSKDTPGAGMNLSRLPLTMAVSDFVGDAGGAKCLLKGRVGAGRAELQLSPGPLVSRVRSLNFTKSSSLDRR